jgi:N-acylneuraminate cytidylyltransferase
VQGKAGSFQRMTFQTPKILTLAVIPARGGSKRLPKKNIRPLLGRPLIAYTIEAAIESDLFDRVIVSTESEEIAEISHQFGAEVPFLRDAGLADDMTPVSQVTVNVLERLALDGTNQVHVAQLMPNCPLRTSRDLQNSHSQFIGSHADCQISVTRYGWQNPWFAMLRDETFRLKPLFEEWTTQRSQDQPQLFCKTGAIWWARSDVLFREGTFHVSNVTGWEMPWQHAVDIDTEQDWQMAEFLITMREEKQPPNVV